MPASKRYYDEHQRQFGVPESREASHILIAVDKSASEDAKKKARAQAEQIYNELKKNPNAFAELASNWIVASSPGPMMTYMSSALRSNGNTSP